MEPFEIKQPSELRGLEAIEAYLDEARKRISDLNTEHAGVAMPEEARSEWIAVGESITDVEKLEQELRDRAAYAARILREEEDRPDGPRNIEPLGRGVNVRKPVENPYDLSAIRDMNALEPGVGIANAREHARRAVAMETYPGTRDADAAKTAVDSLLAIDGTGDLARRILLTGRPEYKSAFGKVITGEEHALTDRERQAMTIVRTALAAHTSTAGLAVPFTLDPTVILTSNGVLNPLRAISRVINITGTTWKGLTSEGIQAAYAAEGTEASDNAPTFVQPEITPQRAQAFVPFSMEIGQDWVGLQSELTRMFADAKDTLEATKFFLGAGVGSNEPLGIITALDTPDDDTSIVDTASIGAFAVADLYTLLGALPPRFQPNARFVANLAIYNLIRQFDDEGGADLWVQLGAGVPSVLLGLPAHQASVMASAVAANNKILLLGDFSQFAIVDRVGMTVELIPHLFGSSNRYPTGQRGLYCVWRNSSGPLTENAFRLLEVKAS